jgi:hypothetical protein
VESRPLPFRTIDESCLHERGLKNLFRYSIAEKVLEASPFLEVTVFEPPASVRRGAVLATADLFWSLCVLRLTLPAA